MEDTHSNPLYILSRVPQMSRPSGNYIEGQGGLVPSPMYALAVDQYCSILPTRASLIPIRLEDGAENPAQAVVMALMSFQIANVIY